MLFDMKGIYMTSDWHLFYSALEISLNLWRQSFAVDILEFGGNLTAIFSLGFIVRGILKHMS